MPDPRPLPDGPLHFVGIGGAGMSALAFVLASRGHLVSGSDPGIQAATRERLESAGCTIASGPHAAENVPAEVVAVIVTDAVKGENPEVTEAERRGIPIFKRPEALGSVVNAAKISVCVAGTHGKTTTTGMVASILVHAGLNPTVLIGGDLPLIGGNAQSGDPDLVVAEACEAYGGLDWLKPSLSLILNAEPDHLDFHGSEENFYAAFRRFIKNSQQAICCTDIALSVARNIIGNKWGHTGSYGFAGGVWSPDEEGTDFRLLGYSSEEEIAEVHLQVPGRHNVLNALGAAAVAEALDGIPIDFVVQGLESFTGTGRRFERLGETANGVLVIDDYAHHPTEIRATLQGARQAYPNSRLVAIFQPHLPSRTNDFLEQFADALANGGAYAVYLTDIYLAREPKQEGLIELLAGKVPGASLIADRFALPERLKAELQPGDVAIFMGAGNIREQAEAFLAL
ncbi:MAG: UDP-N-acetylmuramate--L-alanine ligase [Armatimonas sp.]